MRVFISYSHDDRDKYREVKAALTALGSSPWSDEDLMAGPGFSEQIQKYISHSHLFVAIITPTSHARGWVHQEIGFAVAMHVPVIPICIGHLPEGMIQMAHAVVIHDAGADFGANCLAQLKRHDFSELVANAGKRWLPAGECAHEPGERAVLIEKYADEALSALKHPQPVRHAGGLSSFRIPDESPSHASWKAHYADKPRDPEIYKKLRRERQALAKHAEHCGCKLIVNYGVDLDRAYGEGAWHSRLRSLTQFLESMDDQKVEIALVEDAEPHAFLAVGNWFSAESVAVNPIRGIQHTLFASHAPTIDLRVADFDHDLNSLLKEQGSPAGQSRTWAIGVLKKRMGELRAHPAWK